MRRAVQVIRAFKLALVAGLFFAAALSLAGPGAQAQPNAPATVLVDLRQARQELFHAAMDIPVKPGPMVLVYPRWIPGDHNPSGPIENLAGLEFSVNGVTLPWTRDPKELDAFKIVVPTGATRLSIKLDFLAAPSIVKAINPASNATSDTLAILRWHTVLLYPKGVKVGSYNIQPSVELPAGWHLATAMTPQGYDGATTRFETTTLERLVDSPVLAGEFTRTYRLAPGYAVPHRITIAADDPADLILTNAQQASLSKLVYEARALFGSKPFTHYDFLLNISGKIRSRTSIGGQEHQESSDDTGGPGVLKDERFRESVGDTLSHEYAHAWNGKYRRPIGEFNTDYQTADDDSLLWVYEGMTAYLGHVLAARTGFWSAEDFRNEWADNAAEMDMHPGRAWRNLQDSAVSLPTLMRAGPDWSSWRRGPDYYPEGALLWLEIDVKLRALSGDRRSFDDFAHIFFAKNPSKDPLVKPYSFNEIVADLNAVAPFDWADFLRTRLESHDLHAPLGGIEEGGWTLTYQDHADPFLATAELDGSVVATFSMGCDVTPDGTVDDVVMGSPAFEAGLGPRMKITGINGAPYSSSGLRAALDTAKSTVTPIKLTIVNGGPPREISVNYHSGQRYPVLARIANTPDRLDAIAQARTSATAP
jgi:predicted metalloprotease with PDZ domain